LKQTPQLALPEPDVIEVDAKVTIEPDPDYHPIAMFWAFIGLTVAIPFLAILWLRVWG